MQRPILIAGPTASGKSDLALAIAEHCGGMIVNADSMQVYAGLRVVTARPSACDMERAPHRLYGHVAPDEHYSVARWLDHVRFALADARRAGLRPIIVGGTGLYFRALTEGLAPVPAVPDVVRASWRARAEAEGGPRLHAELSRRDPTMAARLAPGDTQRIVRALEVVDGTGRSLAEWQAFTPTVLLPPEAATRIVVMRTREELVRRADARFARMIDEGAIEEVASLLRLGLAPSRPVMRALGVRPIAGLIAGRMDRRAVIEAGQIETRQYIKRQLTWLKKHMISWKVVLKQENYKNAPIDFSIIDVA